MSWLEGRGGNAPFTKTLHTLQCCTDLSLSAHQFISVLCDLKIHKVRWLPAQSEMETTTEDVQKTADGDTLLA